MVSLVVDDTEGPAQASSNSVQPSVVHSIPPLTCHPEDDEHGERASLLPPLSPQTNGGVGENKELLVNLSSQVFAAAESGSPVPLAHITNDQPSTTLTMEPAVAAGDSIIPDASIEEVDVLTLIAEEAATRFNSNSHSPSDHSVVHHNNISSKEGSTAAAAAAAATREEKQPQEWGPDDGTIRCVCGNHKDNGFTIQCESCYVWQHAKCVGITKHTVPEYFFCKQCRPSYDPALAQGSKGKVKQKNGSKPRQRTHSFDALQQKQAMGMMAMITSQQAESVHQHCTSLDEESEYLSMDTAAISDEADFVIRHLWKDFCALSSFKSDDNYYYYECHHCISISASEFASLSNRPCLMKRKEFKFRITGDALLEALVASTGYPLAASDAVTTRLLSTLEASSHHRLDYFKRSGLFATETINSGDFIAFLSGLIKSKYEFRKEILSAVYPHHNSYQCLKHSQHFDELIVYRLQPYVYFLDGMDIMVDMQKSGNKSRFIRRSCHPNVEVKGVFVQQKDSPPQFHLALFARDTLRPGDELFMPFDYKNGNRYFRYHCNCHLPSFCLAEPPFPEISETTCHQFFSSASTNSLTASSSSLPGHLGPTSVDNALFSGRQQQSSTLRIRTSDSKKRKHGKHTRSSTSPVGSRLKMTAITAASAIKESSRPFKMKAISPRRSVTPQPAEQQQQQQQPQPLEENRDETATTTEPSKPSSPKNLSREERKLQMYIEAIQRNEERERKRQQRMQHHDQHPSKSLPTSAASSAMHSNASSTKSSPTSKRKRRLDSGENESEGEEDVFVKSLMADETLDDEAVTKASHDNVVDIE